MPRVRRALAGVFACEGRSGAVQNCREWELAVGAALVWRVNGKINTHGFSGVEGRMVGGNLIPKQGTRVSLQSLCASRWCRKNAHIDQ